MKKSFTLFISVLAYTSVFAQSKADLLKENQQLKSKVQTMEKAKEVDLTKNQDKFSYALGINVAKNLQNQGLTDSLSLAAFMQAFEDLKKNTLKMNEQEANMVVQENYTRIMEERSKAKITEGKAFLEKNKSVPGVITLPSGMQYQVLKEGNGPKPSATNTVRTHYHGTLLDGRVFDSSVQRGEPAEFPVNGVIQGWVEALQLMSTGSKWKLFIPYNLAYGERGAGGMIGPYETLVFEVELLEIVK